MENELPEGWVETALGDIAFWGSGGTPDRSEKKYYDGNIPWIKTGDLNDDVLIEASEYITELGLNNSSAKLFPKDSIAIAMYGATIGKLAILGIDAATNQACGVAQVHEGVENKLLYYYLKSQKENFINQGKGGAQPNISQSVLKLHPFPLPPLAEQKRIAAKLDAAFAHLETLKASLARIPELLKKFRQTVLTQAVTGKLIGSGTDDWKVTTLEHIIESKPKNGYSANPVDYETPFKVLTLTSTTSGRFSSNYFKYFNESIDVSSPFWLKPNDILIQRGNTIEYVGVPAIYDGKPDEFIYPDLMIKLRANENLILTKYLYFSLSSNQARNYLRERATGTTGNMPRLTSPH